MDFFDRYDEIRRRLDQLTSLPDSIREVTAHLHTIDAQLAAVKAATHLPLSALEELNRLQTRVDLPLQLLEAQSVALKAAMSPLPDVSWLASVVSSQTIQDVTYRLHESFLAARVLGQFDLEARIDADEPAEEADSEEDLVSLVPAEALDDLRRVGFVPIVLLDRVIRNPTILHQISARDFEALVATLIEEFGFEDVTLTPRSRDGGRDVLATKRPAGIPILFAFECKRNAPDRPVGVDVARALFGTIMHPSTRANKGVLVTTSRLTPDAWRYIVTEPSLAGKEFTDVVGWLHEYAGRHWQRRT